jgi:hypothetical protein
MALTKGEILRDTFSVKNYGAKGDGVTDDTASIQAALNAAGEYSEVVFPPGIYKVTDTVTLGGGSSVKQHVRLNGVGCKLIQDTTLKKTLKLSYVYDVEVFGFEIVGKGNEVIDTGTSWNGVAGIYIENSTNVRVHHNFLNNHAGGGIRWATETTGGGTTYPGSGTVCQDINISHNTVRGMGTSSISALDNKFDSGIGNTSSANYVDIVITDNDVSEHAFGINASAILAGSCNITNNYVHDIRGQHGIYANPISNGSISNNTIRNCRGNGIKVQIRDDVAFNSQSLANLTVNGNSIMTCDIHGIEFTGAVATARRFADTCVISNNSILSLAVNGARGIQLLAFDGVVKDNTISKVKGYGIYGDSVAGTISGNDVEDIDYNGAYLAVKQSAELQFNNNTFTDCTLNTQSIAGSDTRVQYYVNAVATYSSTSLYIEGNTFKSETTETADYDNPIKIASGIAQYIGRNTNNTDHAFSFGGTKKYLNQTGFSKIPAQTKTGAGAIDVTRGEEIVWIVTDSADALTLPDGTEQQKLYIIMKTDAGTGTLTPSNLGNGTTITFDDVGDSAHLIFTNSNWYFMGGTATLA